MANTGDDRVQLYPRRLTCVLSSAKVVSGCGLLTAGAFALYLKASYGDTASGLWAGTLVIISGVFGIFSVLRHASRPYVLSFFASCVLSLIASVLVIIYSATGLARDSGFPNGFARDMETDEIKDIPEREIAMLVNLVLILLGVLDVLFTLPSCIICLRDLCECYNANSLLISERHSGMQGSYVDASTGGTASTGEPNDWLTSWLGQQSQIFYSTASGNFPYSFSTKLTTGNSGQPYHLIPAGSAASRGANTPPFVFIPSDPSQVSVTPAVPVPVSPGMLKQLPSPQKQGGSQGSHRYSKRDHHSPQYHLINRPYQQQKYHQRHESEASSGRSKRRTRPRSGSPFRDRQPGTKSDHHRPRPRPHSTPNTTYSQIEDTPYSPVGIYPTLPPPPPHHAQYIYATTHPSQIASYPSPGSNFSHLYPPHLAPSAAPQLLQVSPWGMPTTADDYEAYLAGAVHTQQHYHSGHPVQRPHRDAQNEVDSGGGSQTKSRRQFNQRQKPHYGQHNHQLHLYRPPYNYPYQQIHRRHRSKSSDKKYGKSIGGSKDRKRKGGPSDSDLDKTYTGMDRELAEEFIEQTMDPSSRVQASSSSVIVHEENKRPSSKAGGGSHGRGSAMSGKQNSSMIMYPPTSITGDDETQEESAGDTAW